MLEERQIRNGYPIQHFVRIANLRRPADRTAQSRGLKASAYERGKGGFLRAADNVVGSMQGVPNVIDATLPTDQGPGTNQDVVVVMRVDDSRLFESAPVTRALVAPLSGNLAVRLQAYGSGRHLLPLSEEHLHQQRYRPGRRRPVGP